MANVIIGIHGLGNKPHKEILADWWKLAMTEGLKANNFSSSLPRFELVYWADILYDQPLCLSVLDVDNPYYLREKYIKASGNFVVENHNLRKKLQDFVNHQLNRIFLNEDLSLNYSYITDAIVRKYFYELEVYYKEICTVENAYICKAKELIKERLQQVMEKYREDDILLICHSMGSIIAFDVLSFLSPHIPVQTFVTMGSPLGLPIIVSKIAAEQKQMKDGADHMFTPASVTKNWFNFSDIMDRIAFNYQLADDFSENWRGVKPVDFLVVNSYQINGHRNPHKSYGYLRTPEFAKVLDEFIQSERLSLKEKIKRKVKQIILQVKAKIARCIGQPEYLLQPHCQNRRSPVRLVLNLYGRTAGHHNLCRGQTIHCQLLIPVQVEMQYLIQLDFLQFFRLANCWF